MKMRREEDTAFDVVAEMTYRGPGDGHPVVVRRSAADFVHQHQRVLGRVIENRARFEHLHHERRPVQC